MTQQWNRITHVMSQDKNTVLWAQRHVGGPNENGDFKTAAILYMYETPDGIVVPVEYGMHVGIGVYTYHGWAAYPAYFEHVNVWLGGPNNANECTPMHLWETKGPGYLDFNAWLNQDFSGQPILVVESGTGDAAGEQIYGTTSGRGLFEIYRRYATPETAEAWSPHEIAEYKKAQQAAAAAPVSRSGAAVGAGKQFDIATVRTQVEYQPTAELMFKAQLELRTDIKNHVSPSGDNQWEFPVGEGHWWERLTPYYFK